MRRSTSVARAIGNVASLHLALAIAAALEESDEVPPEIREIPGADDQEAA